MKSFVFISAFMLSATFFAQEQASIDSSTLNQAQEEVVVNYDSINQSFTYQTGEITAQSHNVGKIVIFDF